MVIIYDEAPLHREGFIEGAYYVRENQQPPALRPWEAWLKSEWDERERRHCPASPLRTRREVVQAIRHRGGERWALRLAGGYVDGPYYDWAFGVDLVGKVVGIYLPSASEGEC